MRLLKLENFVFLSLVSKFEPFNTILRKLVTGGERESISDFELNVSFDITSFLFDSFFSSYLLRMSFRIKRTALSKHIPSSCQSHASNIAFSQSSLNVGITSLPILCSMSSGIRFRIFSLNHVLCSYSTA